MSQIKVWKSKKQFALQVLLVFGLFGWALFAGQTTITATADVLINEIIVQNGHAVMEPVTKNFVSAIELYNPSAVDVDLGGFWLTDDLAEPNKWQIPAGTMLLANSYLVFWADGLDDDLHTNFKLKEGEVVGIFDTTNTLVDSIDYPSQWPNISYGRNTDGSGVWAYFGQPTIGSANDTASAVAERIRPNTPQVMVAEGFYTDSVQVGFEPTTAEIRYTTDGSIPTAASTLYAGPFTITSTTTIRAQAFEAGKLPSKITLATYFVDETFTMPVVSIALNEEFLFDDDIGIHVPGNTYVPGDDWTGNYYQEWERPIALQFFEDDGTLVFSTDAGTSIHGNYSRQLYRKSLSIDMREQYGADPIEYQLFEDRSRTVFEDFILRTSGGDYNNTVFRDALSTSLIENFLDMDLQGYRPAILFVNGEYWGIYNIREKTNANTLKHYHNIDEDNLDILREKDDVIQGDEIAYNALRNYINTRDLSQPVHYNYVASQMDMDEFMNYYIAQIYYTSSSWPKNNIKYWRERDPAGKWRWILFDTDSSFDLRNEHSYQDDKLAEVLDPAQTWGSLFMRNLVENQGFKQEFAQRFAANLNITFHPSRVNGFIDDIQGNMEPEMPRHIARWEADPWGLNNMAHWYSNISIMRRFANNRPTYVFAQINTHFNLTGTTQLTVGIDDPARGNVFIHDVPMPEPSFTGDFFRGLPIQLEAVAETGYQFVEWQSGGIPVSNSAVYSVTIDSPLNLTAVFAALPPVVINEIHYHPASFQGDEAAYEFIELHNPGLTPIDLSGYYMDGIVYTFTVGTTIAPGQYLVLAQTAATYAGQGYTVYQWHSGGLNNSGETVRLYTSAGYLLDEVPYQDSLPWPTEPDGDGPSLSLISPNLDNALPSSWEPSAIMGGTPGGSNTAVTHPIILTEFHYNPNELIQGSDADYEFLELYNAGAITVTLAGYQISNGIAFTFPAGAQLGPNKYLLVAKNSASYPSPSCTVYQWASGSLDNAGELVRLVDNNGVEVDAVVYDDAAPWPTVPDGDGPSLDLRSASLNNALASSWMASAAVGGSPCASSVLPDPSAVTLRLASASTTHTSTHGLALFILGYVLLASASWVLLNVAAAPTQGKQ